MDTPTLALRLKKFSKAMSTYSGSDTGMGDDDLVDILADAMHFCAEECWSFDCFLEQARVHYEAERGVVPCTEV